MEIEFYNETTLEFDNYEIIFNDLLHKVSDLLHIDKNYFIEVNLVNNEKIRQINNQYRNIDKETDVISFAFLDDVEGEVKIIGDCPILLGEIFISIDKAILQAKEYGHPLKREMKFLFIHGVLHLLGYDHMNSADEKIMFELQDEILKGETYDE